MKNVTITLNDEFIKKLDELKVYYNVTRSTIIKLSLQDFYVKAKRIQITAKDLYK